MLMEQLQYNMLFRWFVGLNMDDEVGTPPLSARNREPLAARRNRGRVLRGGARVGARQRVVVDEHFTLMDDGRRLGELEKFPAEG